MEIFELVKRLQDLGGADREVDQLIDNFTKSVASGAVATTWESKWLAALPGVKVNPPNYTGDIDAAFRFAEMITGSERGGFGWESGRASAKIGAEGFACQSAEPAIAICLSGLLRYAKLHLSRQ